MRQICSLFLVSVAIILGGCASASDKNNSSVSKKNIGSTISFPEQCQYKTKNLTIDIDEILLPDKFELYETNAEVIKPYQYAKELKKNFYVKKSAMYSEEAAYDDDGHQGKHISWMNETDDHYFSGLDFYGTCMSYQADNCIKSMFVDDAFRFYERQGTYSDDKNAGYNADKYYSDYVTGNSDVKISQVLDKLEKAGVYLGKTLTAKRYKIDLDTVKKEWCFIRSDGTKMPSPDFRGYQTTYYYFARQNLQGLPVLFYDYSDALLLEKMPIQFVYNEKQCLDLSIKKAFSFRKTGKKLKKLLSYEKILDVIKKRYEMLLGNSQYCIDKAGLYYYAKGNGDRVHYTMIPVWAFNVIETQKDTSEVSYSTLLINALTGLEEEYEP